MTSNRRLARMPPHLALTAGQLAKLALYPNGGIRTTRELLEKSKIELVENCDLDGEIVEDIKRKVSRWIAPKSVTVNIPLLFENRVSRLPMEAFANLLTEKDDSKEKQFD